MRLVCPNCDAQYEVSDDLIPEEGRDVQCSNCGQTWFQRPAEYDAELAEDLGYEVFEPEPVAPEPAAPARKDEDRPYLRDAPEAAKAADAGGRTRRRLDPSVAEVLREEAAFAAKAREAGLESQPDLGLDEAGEARPRRPAPGRGRPAPDTLAKVLPTTVTPPGSRRDLLPDIDEINSSLRAGDDPIPAPRPGPSAYDGDPRAGRRGFRIGFAVVVLFAAALLSIYTYAGQIAEAWPPATPYLEAYVIRADAARAWLDEGFAALTARLEAMMQ